MSMIVIFVPCIKRSLLGKRLASTYSALVDDVPNGVSGNFLAHFPDLMKEMVWFEKVETEEGLKALDECAKKLDVVAAAIFTLIDVKGESESQQQQPCNFCIDHFLDSGWTFCGGRISFLNTIEEYYHIECPLCPIKPICYLLSTTKIYFRTS